MWTVQGSALRVRVGSDATVTLFGLTEAPLEHSPVLVRAGAVLPMEKGGRLELHLYRPPDGEAGSGQLYNDAGDGYGP